MNGVLATLPDRLVAYDFKEGRRPLLFRTWDIPGIRGALDWQNAVLVFGENGFEWIDLRGERQAGPSSCETGSIIDAACSSRAFYSVTAEGLQVYSARLCKTSTIEIEGARSIALTTGIIIVGGRRGLSVFDANEPLQHRNTCAEDLSVSRVLRPLGAQPGTILAVLKNGSARLFQISRGDPKEIARFKEVPWFADSTRLGDLLLRIGRDRSSLVISRFGEARLV
jgi:hypothetical protein